MEGDGHSSARTDEGAVPTTTTTAPTSGHRFGVLWCEDSSKWAGFEHLFRTAFGCEGLDEEWEVFDVCHGQLPPIERLSHFTGRSPILWHGTCV